MNFLGHFSFQAVLLVILDFILFSMFSMFVFSTCILDFKQFFVVMLDLYDNF